MTSSGACEQRTLVLSAFAAEADAVLSHTTLDASSAIVAHDRHFLLGSIGGKKVIVAMTGIGLVNARNTMKTALARFNPSSSTTVGAVVFSGVAAGAGRAGIGDVAIPARWTIDDGKTFHPVHPGMLVTAQSLSVTLERHNTWGPPIRMGKNAPSTRWNGRGRRPRLVTGGQGASSDDSNGATHQGIRKDPEVLRGRLCNAGELPLANTGDFIRALAYWSRKALLSHVKETPGPSTAFEATDMETAAVQAVADAHGIPFIGIRGIAGSPGDPAHLPGYSIASHSYKQLAGCNAALVTAAFIRSWSRV